MASDDWVFATEDDPFARALEMFFRLRPGWRVDEDLIRYTPSFGGAHEMPKRFYYSDIGVDFLEITYKWDMSITIFPSRIDGGCPEHYAPAQVFPLDASFANYPWDEVLHDLPIRAAELVISSTFIDALDDYEKRARDTDPADIATCVLFGPCAMTSPLDETDRGRK